MTREEAIQYLTDTGISPEHIMELVEALEQEPCEDAISRQAVLEYIARCEAELGHSSENEVVCQDIKELPPVNPQKPNWIPVSERYPQIEDEYKYFLVTDYRGKVSVQKFYISLDEEPQPYFSGMVDVIAWMPLPEPYKAESEDKE